MTQEALSTSPLEFIVIGSGQVVDKYWLRSERDKSVHITNIISLEPKASFYGRNPDYQGAYYQSTSVTETLEQVTALAKKQTSPNVALATPAEIRLELTRGILSNDQTRVFIEKPYADTQTSLDTFKELLTQYSVRMHLSGKYANGRANILYPHLPEGKIPKKITGRLIEGTEYYNVVQRELSAKGWHQYLIDGPELDLGFHLLDIVGVGSERFGGLKAIKINDVCDLSKRRKEFEVQYGFGVELKASTPSGNTIDIDLQAGKADAPTERFIEFDYGEFAVGQVYTPGDSIDPVYLLHRGSRQVIVRHQPGYNYYVQELHPLVFCRQSPTQQRLSLSNTGICLDIKEERQALVCPLDNSAKLD